LTRLTQRKDFLAAASGRRVRCAALNVQVRDRQDQAGLRIGLTASRKTGNAVERNRIRRRLRVAAQMALASQSSLPVDLVIVARREVLRQSFATLVSDIAKAPSGARPPKPRPDSAPKAQSAHSQTAVTRT
ncbi:MAG: ribonuclease P protein component, partial [Bosea sp. (in: a-proteobacteria)]